MAIFKGFVKLSQKNYELLKKTGTLTIGDKTITYEPKTTFYITPYVPPVAGAGGDVDLTGYVKITDYATYNTPGVVITNAALGTQTSQIGMLQTVAASISEIDERTQKFKPIVPNTIDYAVKKALIDNKLSDTEYAWTDDDKKAARTLIGATNLNTHLNYGIQNNNTGLLMIVKATNDELRDRSTTYKPVVPTNLDFAVVQGLIGKRIETTADDGTVTVTYEHPTTLSDEEKISANDLIGSVKRDTVKQTWLAGAHALYGTYYNGAGEPTTATMYVKSIPIAGRIPMWSGNNTLRTENPVGDTDCVNKQTVTSLSGTTAPTTETAAIYVGQIYNDTAKNDTYMCTAIDKTTPSYTWIKLIRENNYAGNSVKGVVDVRSFFGTTVDSYGRLSIVKATEDEIKAKANEYHPLVPKDIDLIVKTGLSNNTNTLSTEEKQNARNLIGAVGQTEINNAIDGLGTVFDLKGSKATVAELPTEGNSIGDVWYVEEKQAGYIWLNDGTTDRWEQFGAPIDLSGYATKNNMNTELAKYLPLSAGSDKPLTGQLYANKGVVVNSSSLSANNTEGIVFAGTDNKTFIGADSSSLGIYSKGSMYLRPGTETDTTAGVKITRTDISPTTSGSMSLGTSDNKYNNIYGTTIYQNGKQVANTEDLNSYVPTARTINNKALSSNIALGNKDVGALPDYTLTISHQSAGNPRMVKFVSVNYASRATCFKMAAMTCHDNGVSYQFLTDMLIAVTTAGEVTANIYKFAQREVGAVDGITRRTGDVFYVNDTTNKIVDFYILCGQWSESQFTPVTKVGNTTIDYVTQYSGTATYYSSGEKTWVNGCGTTYARLSDIPTDYVTTNTDQTVDGNKTFSNAITSPIYKSDSTPASFRLSDNNELNFGSNATELFIGYDATRISATNPKINVYHFGDSNKTANGGTIYCNNVYVNNGTQEVAKKADIPTNNNQLTNGAGYMTASGMTNESGTNYIRFANGFQICWGIISGSNSEIRTITLTKPFKDTNYEVLINTGNQNNTIQLTGKHLSCSGKTTTSFQTWTTSAAFYNRYVAFGMWK